MAGDATGPEERKPGASDGARVCVCGGRIERADTCDGDAAGKGRFRHTQRPGPSCKNCRFVGVRASTKPWLPESAGRRVVSPSTSVQDWWCRGATPTVLQLAVIGRGPTNAQSMLGGSTRVLPTLVSVREPPSPLRTRSPYQGRVILLEITRTSVTDSKQSCLPVRSPRMKHFAPSRGSTSGSNKLVMGPSVAHCS